jgi:hypothetical protein
MKSAARQAAAINDNFILDFTSLFSLHFKIVRPAIRSTVSKDLSAMNKPRSILLIPPCQTFCHLIPMNGQAGDNPFDKKWWGLKWLGI